MSASPFGFGSGPRISPDELTALIQRMQAASQADMPAPDASPVSFLTEPKDPNGGFFIPPGVRATAPAGDPSGLRPGEALPGPVPQDMPPAMPPQATQAPVAAPPSMIGAQAPTFGFGALPVPPVAVPPVAPQRVAQASATSEDGEPAPRQVPLPPPRPLSFGALPPAAPAATPQADMPAVGAAPASGQAPADAGFDLSGGLKRFRDAGGGDLLTSLGIGLMSTRGLGAGLAAGLQNDQQQQSKRAAAGLATAEMDLKRQKFARDAQGQNSTRSYLLSKGLSPDLADAAMTNPTILSSTLGQLNKDPARVTIGGNIYELKPGDRPNASNLVGPADAEREKLQLVDVPQADGTSVKTWVKPGESSGQAVGAPERSGNSNVAVVTEERRKVADSLGWKPDSDQYKSFVATGKLPKEDQQSLTVTDKNAILEADEKIAGAKSTIGQLKNALELSKSAYSGPFASARGYAGSIVGLPGAVATQNLDNQVTSQALENLKATFGGAPTEGERAILLQVQGASSQAPEVRDEIYKRAIAAAERRQAFNEQRAKELRGGTYYKTPQASVSADGAPASAAPATSAPAPKSKADYDALPSGAKYLAPDGTMRQKP